MKATRTIPLLLALAAVWRPARAQTTPASAPAQTSLPDARKPLYRITGTLVDAVTGDPVPRATVSAATTQTRRSLETTQTAVDGHFQLTGLPAGKYALIANKVGYQSTAFDQHQFFSSAIVTGEDQSTEDLRFPITPSSSLRVHVVDDFGEPVDGAVVTIAHRVHGAGFGVLLVPRTFWPTGLDGLLVAYALDPGDYYVAVSAHPWYAMHNTIERSGSGESRSANPTLDVAYPITFFDGAKSEASATSIHLLPGAREQITVALHAVPALHLSISAINIQGSREESGVPIRAAMRSWLFGSDFNLSEVPQQDYDEKGNLTLSGVAPGAYQLLEGDPQRRVELNLSASTEIAGNAGTGAAALNVTVRAPDRESLPQELKFQLSWQDKVHPQLPHSADLEAGKCSFETLPPGDWELQLAGRSALVPILSISVNGRTAATNHIHVGDKPIELEVVARASALRVDGLALSQGRGQPGVLVLLVPVDLRNHSDWMRHDQSDSDGSFTFPAVPSGNYTLIALKDAWDLDWQSPEFLSRFLADGVAITIPDQPTGIYRLPVAAKIQSALSQPPRPSAEAGAKQN
jgi:hypothetical protein